MDVTWRLSHALSGLEPQAFPAEVLQSPKKRRPVPIGQGLLRNLLALASVADAHEAKRERDLLRYDVDELLLDDDHAANR